jgi:hypothetical protein
MQSSLQSSLSNQLWLKAPTLVLIGFTFRAVGDKTSGTMMYIKLKTARYFRLAVWWVPVFARQIPVTQGRAVL